MESFKIKIGSKFLLKNWDEELFDVEVIDIIIYCNEFMNKVIILYKINDYEIRKTDLFTFSNVVYQSQIRDVN